MEFKMPKYIIHDGTQIINVIISDSELEVQAGQYCEICPDLAENQQIAFDSGSMVVITLPTEHHQYIEGNCIVSDFVTIKDSKENELVASCEAAIVNTVFTSNALGSAYQYDCRRDDQANIRDAYTEALGDSTSKAIKCSSDNGATYNFVDHSQEQCFTVLKDMAAHIKSCRDNLETKRAELQAIDPEDTMAYPTHTDVINAINSISF